MYKFSKQKILSKLHTHIQHIKQHSIEQTPRQEFFLNFCFDQLETNV